MPPTNFDNDGPSQMIRAFLRRHTGWGLLVAPLILVVAIYWPGLHGSWLFDDYPNIVDNQGVQPTVISLSSLINAVLSSPASEFKRPLASLSFAANYLATGLDPYWMKLTNLAIHLLNGVLVFVLARALIRSLPVGAHPVHDSSCLAPELSRTGCAPTQEQRSHTSIVAALIAASWMLLPINLTAVLYVVQRMESMANVFVLTGLIGYVAGRQRTLAAHPPATSSSCAMHGKRASRRPHARGSIGRGFVLCLCSIVFPTAFGLLAKETAVMLPLYALLIEWALFRFRPSPAFAPPLQKGLRTGTRQGPPSAQISEPAGLEAVGPKRRDWCIITMFLVVLVLPMTIGLAWLLPGLLSPSRWATRDFTLGTRLLSEARIVVDYVGWTLLPSPQALSFYHDDFIVSSGLLTPWTTLASITALTSLLALTLWLRRRRPLAALGIALFLGCHLLTGTILPLELIYEHRNYFASFGLLLTVVPLLVTTATPARRFMLPRFVLFAGLLLWWSTSTAITVHAWGNPLHLAEELAARAPDSPRAQYELGRTYIIYSHYDPNSPFTRLAYAPLERAAALPESSILPQQALIFMNAHMNMPIKDAWWDSMITKLKAHTPGVQDESSLITLAQYARDHHGSLPEQRMTEAFLAALSHLHPTARLQAAYGDYAWDVLGNTRLGLQMTESAVRADPSEAAYRISLIRRLVASGRDAEANRQLQQLGSLNIGGRLNAEIAKLNSLLGVQQQRPLLHTSHLPP